jgi:hypothetical protein
MHDLVIRGATVVDGLGHDPISADVAIRDGRIVAIGEVGKDAPEIVDAGGLALMPGVIDLHTHYDAQVTWDPILSPSPSLGVTTAIMGNCGFGIVPSPPHLRGQLLLYPVTDYPTPGTPSYQENAEGYGLTRDTMKWFWDHYLSDPSEGAHPHASPLRAPDLSGLPPALLVTAEYDPLRDEGEFYADKLRANGVPTALTRYDAVNHGFMFWVGVVDKAGSAMNEACDWLRGVFAGPR